MCPAILGSVAFSHCSADGGIIFRLHDNALLLPAKLAQEFLGGAFAIEPRGIEFAVAVFKEDVEDSGAIFDGVYTSLFGAWE